MIVLTLIASIVILSVIFVKRSLSYWKRKKVPYVETSSIWGNVNNPLTRTKFLGEYYAEFYKKFKQDGARHMGFYNMLSPQYLAIDLNVIRNVLEKDFDRFYERGFYYNEKDDPVSANVFVMGGERWKILRQKITPAFTRAKIKAMFEIIMQCAKDMDRVVEGFVTKGESVDVKDLTSRFTMDVIGSCAFGIECNSFDHTRAELFNEFRSIFCKRSSIAWMLYSFASNFPELGRALKIKLVPPSSAEYFVNIARSAVAHRKTSGIRRNDALQALLDLEDGLTLVELAAQCLVFFVAGFETSSSTLSFCLYELSKRLDLQTKAREEVITVLSKYDGELTYDAVEEMTYIAQIVDETLRMYPPLASFTRVCTKDHEVLDTGVVIEKGTKIILSPLGMHHDEQYFSDPSRFDPERFSVENKKKIKPFSYLPFGEGPRMCLGKRFGLLEVKIGLSVLLKNYTFVVNPKVVEPLEWDSFSITLTSKHPLWVDFKKN
ncbi:hypothetical protein FQR65_LT13042 [Abscondita terminalis]|nr:hypothetical protein FQR65_LT13042 [Abscondita terminalis]